MKDKILNIISIAKQKTEFKEAKCSLTINFVSLVPQFQKLKLELWDLKEYSEALDLFNEITSFNFTIEVERGINHESRDESQIYQDGWKSVSYTFHGGEDNGQKDFEEYCQFEFNTLGDRESFRLSEKLIRPDYDSKERWATISGNYCSYEKIEETLDLLLQLDVLLDKQYDEKKKIFNALKLE